jgi:cobalt/nickel transport system permease protein
MSGHLLGGVLAAVLVGPAAGYIIITIVLVVQALLFADGGLSALGLNIVNMALVGSVGGYYLYRLLYRVGGAKHSSVPVLAGIAAFASLPMSAAAFAVEFAIGGTAESISMGAIWAALVGTHALIGIGEGVLTALVVGAVMSARPDLVYGAPTYAGGRTEALV